MSEKHVHEIDRIAVSGNNPVCTWYTENIKKYNAAIIVSLHEIADTELEAKDALLAKLRAIVCPDYEKQQTKIELLEQETVETTEAWHNARLEIASLKAKVQELEERVLERRRLIDRLKQQLSEAAKREQEAFNAARKLHPAAIGLGKHGTLWQHLKFADYLKTKEQNLSDKEQK